MTTKTNKHAKPVFSKYCPLTDAEFELRAYQSGRIAVISGQVKNRNLPVAVLS